MSVVLEKLAPLILLLLEYLYFASFYFQIYGQIYNLSDKYPIGSLRQLYCDAIISPYAPADCKAT